MLTPPDFLRILHGLAVRALVPADPGLAHPLAAKLPREVLIDVLPPAAGLRDMHDLPGEHNHFHFVVSGGQRIAHG